MKKFLVVCAASLLSCFLVHAQEADNTGRGVGLSVIPRLDLNPIFATTKNGSGDFTLGNSSLYSLLEGNISESLSFSVANHWLAADKESIRALYQNTWRSDDVNWLDWAYLTYSFGNFSVSAGKQPMTVGGFELDAYDFEEDPFLNSSVWNLLNIYQWGAKFDWTNDAENTTLALQMTTSPYGERPFASKLFNYSLEWRGEYGNFENIWSVTAVGRDKGDFLPFVTLGQRYHFSEKWTAGLDLFNAGGCEEDILDNGWVVIPSLIYRPCESLVLTGKTVAEYNKATGNRDLIVGLIAEWLPLADSEDLHIHVSTGYHHDLNCVSLNVGALYYINFPRK